MSVYGICILGMYLEYMDCSIFMVVPAFLMVVSDSDCIDENVMSDAV